MSLNWHPGWLILVALTAVAGPARAADSTRELVVRVIVTQRPPNHFQPWTKAPSQEVSGTGFVIEGHRILTNSHVVQHASQIYVQPHQSANKIAAKVVAAAPDVDLAILSLEDDSFFDSHPAIPVAEGLPQVKSTVNVYGYPVGGEQMSITEGIVSRVDYAPYNYGTGGLRVQIDAALNPGNSGGPALSNGRLVGVAFSGLVKAENIGYLIPVEEVQIFLADVADGVYDGKPRLHDQFQTVENAAIRAKLGLRESDGGVMVTRPHDSSPSYPLRENDVITHIAGTPLDSASRVQVDGDLNLPFQYLVPKLAKDGKLPVTVVRGGASMSLEVPVDSREDLLVPFLRLGYPRYFIYGPLVFSPASREMLVALGPRWLGTLLQRGDPLIGRVSSRPAFEGQELVLVASPMFPHRLTKGYSTPTMAAVETLNGIPVRNLRHLAELLRYMTAEYLEFKFAGHGVETLVFRRQEIADATEEILSDNEIRKRASDDLAGIWETGS
ncbi:MAG TPA: trypsin-like peptidase domain-containing protein [Pirellulales bacterium]|nr:trypsin-like peptidase domain-containing protein [Pirellulales bacterium]